MAENEDIETAVVPEEGSPEVSTEAARQADLEGRARRMGWRPKDEFRGDQSRWTDAETFIARGEAELPVLRERYRALDDRFARTESELKELRDRAAEQTRVMGEFRDLSLRAEQRAYARAKSELEGRMREAVASADQAGYDRALAELNALEPPPAVTKEPPKEEPKPTTTKVEPEVQAWIAENEWFNRDPTLNAYAVARHGQLLQERPGMSIAENLAEVRREVVERFPDKFGNPKREKAPAVATSSAPAPSKKKGKSFDDLPSEAKQAFDRFKRMMPDYKQEDYAKMYFAGDDA